MMSVPMKKQLWKRIVQSKIENQAAVLKEMGIDSNPLDEYAASVQSGDKNNREGAAAAVYFKRLIKAGTRRVSAQSAALDYGYSVLRAGIGRAVVGGGWLASQGIWITVTSPASGKCSLRRAICIAEDSRVIRSLEYTENCSMW